MNPIALGSRWLAYAENKVRKWLILYIFHKTETRMNLVKSQEQA